MIVLATPPGRSAVATVLAEGPRVAALIETVFRSASGKPISAFPIGRIVFGRWHHAGGSAEELVVCMRSPTRVEVHCHGGTAAPNAILGSLESLGCRRVDSSEWLAATSRSTIAAEAELAMSQARTLRTADILLAQYHGVLEQEIHSILNALSANETVAASDQLSVLLKRSELGMHLTQPWQIVLAGPPNAGKSSLLNALVGYERAIVFAQPGTTRDAVTAESAIDGWPVVLSDTAGIRSASEPIEAQGVALATSLAESADLLLLVFDSSQSWCEEYSSLVRDHPSALLVHSKCDLPRAPDSRPNGYNTSTIAGEGIQELLAHISRRLAPTPPSVGDAVPFSERQRGLLGQASSKLGVDEREEAIKLLEKILNDPL